MIVEKVDNVSVEIEERSQEKDLDAIGGLQEISNKEGLNLQNIKKNRPVKKEVLEAREALQKQQIGIYSKI